MTPRATVIIPTHDHGPTLSFAARTALDQTVADIELFIIGDGAPGVTRDIVAGLMRDDGRVRFFDFPKGPRLGEAYRHEVLAEARAPIVCYLSDDDLWFPDHVATMESLLRDADFVHALSVRIERDGTLVPGNTIDFRIPGARELALSATLALGGAPLSCMAHTLAIYRQLPRGWHTTPKGVATNVHMTRQFVAHPACRLANATRPTLLRFPNFLRRTWTLQQRVDELARWAPLAANPAWRAALPDQVLDGLLRVTAARWAEIRRLEVKEERMRAAAARAASRIEAQRRKVESLEAKLTAARTKLAAERQRRATEETAAHGPLARLRRLF
ncbi:MAG: glycosyltransferase family 2 protein [Vicinamibacterales bacterium]